MDPNNRFYQEIMLLVRHALTGGGGALALHGLGAHSGAEQGFGAAMAVFSVIWSIINHSDLQTAIDTALQMPQGATRRQLANRLNPERSK